MHFAWKSNVTKPCLNDAVVASDELLMAINNKLITNIINNKLIHALSTDMHPKRK